MDSPHLFNKMLFYKLSQLTKELKELGVGTVALETIALWIGHFSTVRRGCSSTFFFSMNSVLATLALVIGQKRFLAEG